MKNMTIGKRIIISFGTMLGLFAFVITIVVTFLNNISTNTRRIVDEALLGIAAAGQTNGFTAEPQLVVRQHFTAKTSEVKVRQEADLANGQGYAIQRGQRGEDGLRCRGA